MSQQCTLTEVRFNPILCYISKLVDQEEQLSVSGTCKTASQECTVSSFGLLHTGKPLTGSAEGMEMALEYAAYSD